MAQPRLFAGQYRLSMIAVAITLGFITGMSLPVNRSVNPEIIPPLSWSNRQQNPNSSISKVTDLIGQQNQIYKKIVAEWVAEEARRLNFSVPIQFQGKTIEEVKLKGNSKAIALTFDDGPWSSATPQILNTLKKNNIKATFFVVGKHIQRYPDITKQIVTEGHAIGNHTWSHQYHQYSTAAAARELNDTAALVHKLTGVKTALFRPPAGILNNGLVAYAHQQKYTAIMWSADSKDWRLQSTEKGLIENVLKTVKPGGIVLLHDGGGDRSKTVQALPKLISELKKRGYQFVTVPELLEMQGS